VHDRLAGVARQFLQTDIGFAGYVVADAAVPQSVRKRAPFAVEFPNCAAAQCMVAWANRIDHHVDVTANQQRPGFFSRLSAWWR